jgi:uncharacterized phiE125 gp8 family phage protein
MSKLVKETGTRAQIVTLAEAKAWLRVTRTHEDSLIDALLTSSIEWANGVCKRVFQSQAYQFYTDSFDNIELPNAPIATITSISYLAYGETTYTVIADTKYRLNNSTIEPTVEWIDSTYDLPTLAERHDAIKVIYSGGYTDVTLPSIVKTAILLKLNSLYDVRAEENKRWLTSAEYLLMPYRIYNV